MKWILQLCFFLLRAERFSLSCLITNHPVGEKSIAEALTEMPISFSASGEICCSPKKQKEINLFFSSSEMFYHISLQTQSNAWIYEESIVLSSQSCGTVVLRVAVIHLTVLSHQEGSREYVRVRSLDIIAEN